MSVPGPMIGDKFRFRFSKTGTLRLLSHHDLMRCAERMLRRAALPFKSTSGFHPGPRIVFALSLPLGVEGLDEVVEIEFTQPLEQANVLQRLAGQAPAGLAFTGATAVPMKATARARRVVYRVPLPEERSQSIAECAAELMRTEKIWVDRLKPAPKQLNIRPYFRGFAVGVSPPLAPALRGEGSEVRRDSEAIGLSLLIDLWVTQTGTARIDEILRLLGIADLADEGTVVQRITVELRDEVPATDPTDNPPDGPADVLPLEPAALAALDRREEEQPAAAGWGASPAGPVVE